MTGEVDESFFDGHVEDVVDVLAFVLNIEDGGFVTCSITFFTGELDVGQELHLDRDGAVAFADVATAAGDVEGEVTGAEATTFGIGLCGEEGADVVEGLDVGDGVGAWSAADGGLIDKDDVVEVVRACEFAEERRRVAAFGLAESLHEGSVENLMDYRGFARATDSGDTDQEAEGDVDVYAAEVGDAGAGEIEMLAAWLAAVFGDGDGEAAGEVFAGDGVGVFRDLGYSAFGEELAAELACARPEVEEMVGGADDVGVVLDYEDSVAVGVGEGLAGGSRRPAARGSRRWYGGFRFRRWWWPSR